MSTLYIRLPSKAAAEAAEHWTALSCPFALVLGDGSIEREGSEPLAQLQDLIARVQKVALLIAASDVTLLRLQLPPLSGAKLKAALPNLVEDQIISDPSECVIVAGRPTDGLRTVAVMQRAWLDILHRSLLAYGARHITALPAQLCLPLGSKTGQAVSAAITEEEEVIDVALRLSEHEGIGLSIMREARGAGTQEAAAHAVIDSLFTVVPAAPIAFYVPQSSMHWYQQVLHGDSGSSERIQVHADDWVNWIAGAARAEPDLMTGLGTEAGSKMNWHAWRWPLALAGLLLLVNIAAINIDWWRMRSEANSLRTAMTQVYKNAYPKDQIIVDPLAQMRQKISAAKRNSGQAAPDDFAALAAAFGEIWSNVSQGAAIAGIEYRERSLFVRFKDGAPAAELAKAALASRGLSLVQAPPQAGAAVWQIRRAT